MAALFKTPGQEKTENLPEATIRKKTIYSFSMFVLFAVLFVVGWFWLRGQPSKAGKTSAPIRAVLNTNESIFDGLLSDNRLAKEYPLSLAANPARVNGDLGLKSKFDTANWAMQVILAKGDTMRVSLNDIKKLPRTEIVFNFKCIEGWSQITHWAGVRFSEFMRAYGLNEESAKKYLGLATPDKEYYVGIDMRSALHPQTILCYELNGKPLPLNQGYPLRLIIPVKYGVKSLKRIGYMYFDNNRTPDYWADVKGYDYFSGL
ncbi:MAG: molybdopterin-dependent oxidoreductase [Bacteroidetes bacterium]|nr:molybdopterin-dependent oxidoreductase [Bacteroidota bacterium]